MFTTEVTFGQLTEHGDRDLLRHWVAHAVVRCAGVPGDTVQYSTVQYSTGVPVDISMNIVN